MVGVSLFSFRNFIRNSHLYKKHSASENFNIKFNEDGEPAC